MAEDVVIHRTSSVDPGAAVGKGTRIWQNCTVLSGAVIGESCTLAQNVFVEGKTRIGNRVKIKNNVSIFERVELEDDVFVGPSAVFTNVLTPRAFWPRKDEFLPTLVRTGATIGANATIVCG
ncbi:MAG: DapH/DapD/GlmU-related protein, partial [Methanoregulaceae archaeon]